MNGSRFSFAEGRRFDDLTADLLIAACGYESRCTHVAEAVGVRVARIIAYAYTNNQILGYSRNAEVFSRLGSLRTPVDRVSFSEILVRDLREVLEAGGSEIIVDISSFDRERLAEIVRVIESMGHRFEFGVEFVYSFGTFESLQEGDDSTVLVNGPLPTFEGWTDDPSKPVACLIGLGFESSVALAALETLEPALTVALVAVAEDPRFYERVRRDNLSLLGSSEVAVVDYQMSDPLTILHDLEGLIHAVRRSHRVAIVPLGPKLFALLALLVSREFQNEVAVWRVSADLGHAPQDRLASGGTTSLRIGVGSPMAGSGESGTV